MPRADRLPRSPRLASEGGGGFPSGGSLGGVLEEVVKGITAAAPGTLAGIAMLVICFRHIAGEREARAKQAEGERAARQQMATACHAHQSEIAAKLDVTIQQNTAAVLRCAEMHGAVTVALQGVQPPSTRTEAIGK